MCVLDLEGECGIQGRERGWGFIDDRLSSSAKFSIAVITHLVHMSMHHDKDCRNAIPRRPLPSSRDHTATPPFLQISLSCLLRESRGSAADGGAPVASRK